MKANLFESLMTKMGDDFPNSPRIHADWEFALVAKSTKKVQNTKKFRLVAILLSDENKAHIGIIIPELSNEYVELPNLVYKFLSQLEHDGTMSGMSRLEFTGTVYLYTDKLLVSEDSIKKHFEKDNMLVQFKVKKQNPFM
ncbi:MAG: hypothetical protein KGH76_01340 [Thaumarchaeota archaeon]|nr:hypothetical protein [Nitrososphaerota archaeon]